MEICRIWTYSIPENFSCLSWRGAEKITFPQSVTDWRTERQSEFASLLKRWCWRERRKIDILRKLKSRKLNPIQKMYTISKETAWFFAIILQLSNWHNYIPRNCKVVGKGQWVKFIFQSVLMCKVRPFVYRW